jgi:hypothetical protein
MCGDMKAFERLPGESLLELEASLGLLASTNQKKISKLTAAGETLLDFRDQPRSSGLHQSEEGPQANSRR